VACRNGEIQIELRERKKTKWLNSLLEQLNQTIVILSTHS